MYWTAFAVASVASLFLTTTPRLPGMENRGNIPKVGEPYELPRHSPVSGFDPARCFLFDRRKTA
jgi:hypothetical protein